MPRISLYAGVTQTTGQDIDIQLFLDDIHSGRWQDIVLPIRAERSKDARAALKRQLPAVTISGVFAERKDGSLTTHSGYIAIDLDDLYDQVEPVKHRLANDPFIAAAFASVSGNGLCVLFKIEGSSRCN